MACVPMLALLARVFSDLCCLLQEPCAPVLALLETVFLTHADCCRNHVLLEDVEYFLDKAKAKECFDMLDLDSDGKISLQVCLSPLP